MKEISRQALFEEVWSRPLSTIAPEYGLSDVGLRKICDRADIPTPGRGYWAKVAAGKTFSRPKFRPATNPECETIYVRGSAQPAPHIGETLERVRAARATKVKAALPAAKVDEPQPHFEESTPEPTEVHRLAKATVAKITAKETGFVQVSGKGRFKVAVSAEHGARIGQILTLLLTAVEDMGWQAESTDTGFRLLPDGEPLAFEISEQTDKVKLGGAERKAAEDIAQSLKITANSTSYGIFVQVNVETESSPVSVEVFGPDGESFVTKSRKVERLGPYFNPLLATLITGAARLMLALAESRAVAEGLDWVFCDTDSLALARPERMAAEEFEAKAERVIEWFA